jgi:hypothetical protein
VGQTEEPTPKDPWPEQPEQPSWRQDKVHLWRAREAHKLGLTFADAHLFASKRSLDLGRLRDLARKGCPPHLLLHLLDDE